MNIAVVKDADVAPLNILAYVKDESNSLSGEEITKLVIEIIRFAPDTYSIDDIRKSLKNALEYVYGED